MRMIKLPYHKKLTIDRTIKEFEENVDRTNAKTKCLGLYTVAPSVTKELEYIYRFKWNTCRCFVDVTTLLDSFQNLNHNGL